MSTKTGEDYPLARRICGHDDKMQTSFGSLASAWMNLGGCHDSGGKSRGSRNRVCRSEERPQGLRSRREMCLAAAIKWYESGRISQEKAAEIAGLTREAFILALTHYNTSPVQYSTDELAEELERG